MRLPVTVNDLLDGHVGLDLVCLDRIYLNGYVPTLQSGGQVVSFLTGHLGNPIASPALFEKIGARFRADARDYAAAGDIPWIAFRKGERKLDVVRLLLDKAARTGRSEVPAIFRRSCSGVILVVLVDPSSILVEAASPLLFLREGGLAQCAGPFLTPQGSSIAARRPSAALDL